MGKCVCGKCQCEPDWTGPDCACSLDTESCYDTREEATDPTKHCNGNGQCVCGDCVCNTIKVKLEQEKLGQQRHNRSGNCQRGPWILEDFCEIVVRKTMDQNDRYLSECCVLGCSPLTLQRRL